MQKYFTYIECMKNFCKRTSGNWPMCRRWDISFVNIVLEIFRICPLNIRYLQKTTEDKVCHIYNFFFLSAQYSLVTTAE